MDGIIFAARIEEELKKQGISKGKFYDAVGITATALYGWKRGAEPKKETVAAVGKYLGVDFTGGSSDPQEELRDDLRVLLRSASDLPPSSVYALIAQIEKEKEKNVLPD